MSKRKSAIGGILRDVYNWPPTAYKQCEICGYSDVLEAHRIVPGKHGGEYTKYNTMTLCPNCHALITTKKKELKVEYNGDNRIANLINHA